jgi:cysteine desulfuration protein SufE
MDSNFSVILDDLKKSQSSEEIYQKIISLGRTSPFKEKWDFQDSEQVTGCQSLMYVKAKLLDGKIHFRFYSDALISQGLASLLILFYTNSEPKFILTSPPAFLKELNLNHLLSAGRSNGVAGLYKKIIEETLAICKEL